MNAGHRGNKFIAGMHTHIDVGACTQAERWAHVAGVPHLVQHGAGKLAGHEVVLGLQHQEAVLRQVLRPQALAVPHQLPAERLQRTPHGSAQVPAPPVLTHKEQRPPGQSQCHTTFWHNTLRGFSPELTHDGLRWIRALCLRKPEFHLPDLKTGIPKGRVA